jgi:hypothetical protein
MAVPLIATYNDVHVPEGLGTELNHRYVHTKNDSENVNACKSNALSVLKKRFCLFDCLEPHEQFFIYLTAVTSKGDRAAK